MYIIIIWSWKKNLLFRFVFSDGSPMNSSDKFWELFEFNCIVIKAVETYYFIFISAFTEVYRRIIDVVYYTIPWCRSRWRHLFGALSDHFFKQ